MSEPDELLPFFFREKALACNSLSIWAAYRTATVDVDTSELLDKRGYSFAVYFAGDQLMHTLPMLYMTYYCVVHHLAPRPQHGSLALLGQLFFAYSQAGQLDVSDVYGIPHDTTAGWVATVLGQLLAPFWINFLIKKNYLAAGFIFTLTLLPYIAKRLGLRTWHPSTSPSPTPPFSSSPFAHVPPNGALHHDDTTTSPECVDPKCPHQHYDFHHHTNHHLTMTQWQNHPLHSRSTVSLPLLRI